MGAAPTFRFFEKQPAKPAASPARKRKRATLIVAAATVLLGVGSVPMAVELLAGPNSGFPGTGAARTFLDMMNYRSPGERTEARLVEKQRPLFTDVLSERDSAPEAIPPALVELVAPEMVMPAIPVEAPLYALSFPAGPLIGPPGVPIVPPGFIGPPGGGGGGFVPPPVTPPGPPNPPPPPPPGVPEPATWLSMLMGFGILGSAFRRRSSRVSALGRA